MKELPKGEITGLLQGWRAGQAGARERLFELVYPELQRLARRALVGGGRRYLETRDLLHEAYLRLVEQSRADWQCRAHFFGIAATVVRRVMVDQARARGRVKRGGTALHVALGAADAQALARQPEALDVLALDEALAALAAIDAEAAQVVELRYFGGLSLDEAALVLGRGRATIARRWRFARALLTDRLLAR